MHSPDFFSFTLVMVSIVLTHALNSAYLAEKVESAILRPCSRSQKFSAFSFTRTVVAKLRNHSDSAFNVHLTTAFAHELAALNCFSFYKKGLQLDPSA